MRIIPMLLLLVACSSAEQQPAPQRSTAGGAPTQFAGIVAETMNSGGYSYVRIEGAAGSVWAAAPETQVEVGQPLAVSTAMPMHNFKSETLGRSFDVVYFVSSFDGSNAKPVSRPTSIAEAADIDVEHAEGELAIAELWARKAELAGTQVSLRGKVVKYNSGILERNWIHIQDGSGNSGSNTHDLTVTSHDAVEVGELVQVRGVVGIDRDFGAGYSYPLILEEATLTPVSN